MTDSPGPIAVTGASGQVGTLLGERLEAAGRTAVPLGRGDDWEEGIRGAESVVHLAGTLRPRGGESYESANVETARRVAVAVRGSSVRRIVFLSYVGASLSSPNPYLRAKATAEHALQNTGVGTTVFRCLHVYGPPDRPGPTAGSFLAKKGKAVVVPGSGRQRIQPLYAGDVVSAVFDAATREEAPSGVFELGGPDEMTMDELVLALNGPATKIRHLPAPGARLAAHLAPSLTPALMELLLVDNVTATPAAEVGEKFGFEPHRLREVWAAARSSS
jgi:NAD(P)H dehydrogenase (quinone)